MSRKKRRQRIRRRSAPGAPPGTLVAEPGAPRPELRALAWGPDGLHTVGAKDGAVTPAEAVSLRGKHAMVWIDVVGLGDAAVVAQLGEGFGLHPLWLEDVLNAHQRPKVSSAGDVRFVVVRAQTDATSIETEQVSLFVGPGFVLSFQERKCSPIEAVRERAKNGKGRLRQHGADYLAYALLDAVVDSYFPWLERLGERLDEQEQAVLLEAKPGGLAELHEVRRELLVVRRAVWPLREALHELVREHDPLFQPETRVFLSDVYDHTLQILDLVESDREIAGGLVELHLLGASARLNEIIKVLTVLTVIFGAMTVLVGIWGMNFKYMPELLQPWGYPAALVSLAIVGLAFLAWFWRKGWILAGNADRDRRP